MATREYAKVIIADGGPSFEQYRRALAQLAHPDVDVRVLQVGVHEAIIPPHLVRHLVARENRSYRDILLQAGAKDVKLLTAEEAYVLASERVEDDLQTRVAPEVPAAAGGRFWHQTLVKVRTAWDAVGGPGDIDWQGIRLGQIDTGYRPHIALGFGGAGTTWIDTAASRTLMYQDVPPELDPFPAPEADTQGIDPMNPGAMHKGHGTRIGATISGCCRMPDGEMYYGIAPKVPHVYVRITDSVGINTRHREFAEALDYLVDGVQVDVVNVCLGMFPGGAPPAMRAAMRNARRKGVIVVCAAGNYVARVVVPAALDSAIAVAGVTPQEVPWAHSSHGPEVAFSAPAAEIFRAMPALGGVGHDFEGGGDGTSYATAITSGAAALWLRRWRDEIPQKYATPEARVVAFRQAAIATSYQPGGWQPQPFGAGIIDIGALCTDKAKALP